MIYTVGNRAVYEEVLDAVGEGHVYKKGARGDYEGGVAFRTEVAALAYAAEYDNYEVYRVDADWETDVVPREPGSDTGFLLRDVRIYRRNDAES
jgi:hypothetical protein